MNFRQVHLDFHTSEAIEGIGERFDKKQFQSALKSGHVNSITVFSKCHHGYAYHPSEANEQHPGLSFDLLAAEIEAAHEIGVKTPVYLSGGLDEKMARRHPEWLFRNKDETTAWATDFSVPGYHMFCMASPYLEYLAKQVEEVCERYDADGIFIDIVGERECYCQNCIRERIALGVDPYDRAAAIEHGSSVYRRYAERMRRAVDKFKPGLPLFHNGGHIKPGRQDTARLNSHLEIESLPTGGWGYDHFPLSARYCATLGMEFMGMTGKFHTSWGEFGGFKHPNALRYETALSVANGAKCSVGDQLHPSGEMDAVTYELIGRAYAEIEEKEPWLDGVESVADIAIVTFGAYAAVSNDISDEKVSNSDAGACRIMLEGKYLFDSVDFTSDLSKYKVLILPDNIRSCPAVDAKIRDFCARGGKVLASGRSLLDSNGEFTVDLGAKWISDGEYRPTYAVPGERISSLGRTGYVVYTGSERVECSGTELAHIERPYFNRTWDHFCSHRHAPNSGEYYSAGITEGKNGIYISWNIFEDYATMGSLSSKRFVMDALDILLGEGKTLTTDLPAQGVTTLMRQGTRLVNHLLYAAPVKRGNGIEIIEDIVPIYGCNVSIRSEAAPKRVYLAPQCTDIEYTYEGGRISYTVEKIDSHQIVVIEY